MPPAPSSPPTLTRLSASAIQPESQCPGKDELVIEVHSEIFPDHTECVSQNEGSEMTSQNIAGNWQAI